MKYLGIDYGEKRIGVAVSKGSLADPVAVIANDATAAAKIRKLAQDYGAEMIVVGISEGVMAQKSREFAAQLAEMGLRVEFHDETLTSKQAQASLQHKSRQFRAKPQDAYQAAVMLQDWLDNRGVN